MEESSTRDAPIEGRCDARFARVREAFATNFREENEIGAAVCLRIDGHEVVDLWGGYADEERTRPWRRDTLVNAYSVGKGVLSLLVLGLVERGVLRLDARVAELWPEFAAEGKQDVTLRELMSHRAGLPSLRERLPVDAHYDWPRMCAALAAQRPWWEPGRAHGYHVNTFGFLVGEVVRRATGRSPGRVLREDFAGPIGADFQWGLPAARHPDVAEVVAPQGQMDREEQWAAAFPPTGDRDRDVMIWHAYFNPPSFSGFGAVNTTPWRLAEIPSTNGHGTARAVARLYEAALAPAGFGPGPGLVDEATRVHSDGMDLMLQRPSRFGIGFQLPSPERPIGRSPRAFGHYGYGGSLGFADPEARLAFGYVMNRPGERWRTPRTQRLIEAAYDSLA